MPPFDTDSPFFIDQQIDYLCHFVWRPRLTGTQQYFINIEAHVHFYSIVQKCYNQIYNNQNAEMGRK